MCTCVCVCVSAILTLPLYVLYILVIYYCIFLLDLYCAEMAGPTSFQRTICILVFLTFMLIIAFLHVFDWKGMTSVAKQVMLSDSLRGPPMRLTPSNVTIFLANFDGLNAFYGNGFTFLEKTLPQNCPLPDGGTCILHHSNKTVDTSDAVFRVVQMVQPTDRLRYYVGQLLIVMNSEAERGEYGLNHLREADIKIDHHSSSDIMLSEKCGLPVEMLENSPPPDPAQRKGIAMFTSNCAAQWRSEYFEKLMKFVHIDSYGNCFHNKDEPHFDTPDKGIILRNISSKYRMLVTFENLIQDDYITEKINYAFSCGVIPVYWGPPQIYSWVPGNHSFIDASQYTPEDLAKYLKRVDKEDDLFRYHTTNFDVNKTKKMIDRFCPKGGDHYLCRACRIAHTKLTTRNI